jgi:hypothetical protein
MTTELSGLLSPKDPKSKLSPSAVSKIKMLCDVASVNGASLSIRELLSLVSFDASPDQLEVMWRNSETISSEYQLMSGIVVSSTSLNRRRNYSEILSEIRDIERENSQRLSRAKTNIALGEKFGRYVHLQDLRIISISGSTSYLSVSSQDDLDFFCVTTTETMWKSFVSSLLLARFFKLVHPDSPKLCLSYFADETFVRNQFRSSKSALFARDALSALVLRGDEIYVEMLKENRWIEERFPKLYAQRLQRYKIRSNLNTRETANNLGSSIRRIVNLLLYYTAGTYIRIKANLLNRKLSRMGKSSSEFKLRIGLDHCIYESADYMNLRKMYSRM